MGIFCISAYVPIYVGITCFSLMRSRISRSESITSSVARSPASQHRGAGGDSVIEQLWCFYHDGGNSLLFLSDFIVKINSDFHTKICKNMSLYLDVNTFWSGSLEEQKC